MSETVKVVPVRDVRKFAGPPKFSPPPTVICGSPIGSSRPAAIPSWAGLSNIAGVPVPSFRAKPNRASLTSVEPITRDSPSVKMCRRLRRMSPKPGIVLPWSNGSRR
jgi:hypothetical protein